MSFERFASADELLAAAAAVGEVPAILPRIVADAGGVRIVLPGDPGYDDLVSAAIPTGVPLTAIGGGGAHAATEGS
jgi:hypothetical protein